MAFIIFTVISTYINIYVSSSIQSEVVFKRQCHMTFVLLMRPEVNMLVQFQKFSVYF